MRGWLFYFLLLFNSCSSFSEKKASNLTMQEILGRDDTGPPFPVYRVRAQNAWIRRDPLPEESLKDTTKPLVEFIILDHEGPVRIWIHNFPCDTFAARIPPVAQKERWQRQFESLNPHLVESSPIAFSGYSGLLFCATGILHGKEKAVIACSLQIAEQHNQHLSYSSNAEEAARFKQMRADVTIKAEGAASAMQKHSEEIKKFMNSFELIEEIPDPW